MKATFAHLCPVSTMLLVIFLLSMIPGSSAAAAATPISITSLGSAYTQNFDTLSNTAGSTTNVLSIHGWEMTETGGGARDNEQYAVDTGASGTGDTYSYGAAGSSERALGSLRSGTLIPVYGAGFTNNTGNVITSLDIAYTGEEWRLGTASRIDQLNFEYSLNATDLVTGTWTNAAALNFTTPDSTTTTGAKNGNVAPDRTSIAGSISGLYIANGATFWIRWIDADASSADDGLAVDDFSITAQGSDETLLMINDVALDEGNSGATTFSFTVSLSKPAPAGGVTFDIATADGTAVQPGDYTAKSLTAQTIPAGSSTYTFDVLVNGDSIPEANETFFVNITNITGAIPGDAQGLGTLTNDDAVLIHDVQGNGAASPMVGNTATVEGVVTARFQGAKQLQGFFLQEEDADVDADPLTSEGIFVYCGSCATAAAEGQRVRVSGTVAEFNGLTEISATAAGSVIVTDDSTHLAQVTPTIVALPIPGDVDAYYEARENMLVTYQDVLTVSEYFELAQFGQIILYQGERPFQFTETSAPDAAGYTAYQNTLAQRRVILDDDNNEQNAYLLPANGFQSIFYPRTNGGLSGGLSADTQGADFFRGGDTVSELTGILHWSFPGSGANTWRIRPTTAHPVTFTPANLRPATPPAVSGSIKAVGMNMLNYFTTIDTTSSSSSGSCGPSGTMDCRGADSAAELNRQRERAANVICTLNADVYGLMELENTIASDTITDLLGAVNARCGGEKPYAFVNTGGTLGTDAIRVMIIYRTGSLSPQGAALVDLDPVHSRPPTAQTFEVVDSTSPSYQQRFTVIANHFKSKGCSGASGADADAGDGQGCFNDRRTQQAARLLTWITDTVIPAADDTDVLLLGDFNSYAKETPVTTLTAGGFTDMTAALLGAGSYSYLFDGQLGHLDYAFASQSLAPKIKGIANWHINADEFNLFDYNDEIKDTGEATYEEKPDGSALLPPRIMYQPGTPYRASDHDPVLVGIELNTAPTVSAGGPYTVAEGGSVDLSATGSDEESSPLTYAWDLDNNGTFETSGPNVTFSAAGLDGPSSPTVAVQVTDNGGLTATSSVAVSVYNAAPAFTSIGSSGSMLPSEIITITVTAEDPAGANDPLQYEFDCDNNGTYELGPQASNIGQCTFAKPGTYTVAVRAADDDGGFINDTISVTIDDPLPFKTWLPLIRR